MKITGIKLYTTKSGDAGAHGAALGESQYWGGARQAQTLISNPMSIHPKYSRLRSLWMGGGQDPFVIEIFTDEGVTGFCANYGGGEFACAVIEKHFKRFLIGQDPFNIELIWDQMNRSGGDMEIMIDCYLSWDIEFASRVAERVKDFDVNRRKTCEF